MSESTKHDEIYIQLSDDPEVEWVGEFAWCADRTHEEDVKYIRADLVESLSQQIDWVRNILASHGYDGPLGDGCCPLSEWLNERESMYQQLEASQKREVMLRDSILQHRAANSEWDLLASEASFRKVLAATTDIDGLILCHAEPAAIVYRDYGGNGAILQTELADDEPLYRAWEPKP